VVRIVELAHRRVAGRHHLVVEQKRDLVGAVGVDRVGGAVHLVPPAPEVIARMSRIDAFNTTSQHALEGVAMGVDEPRQTKRGVGHVRILPDRWRTYPENGSTRGSARWRRSAVARLAGTAWHG